MVKVFVGRVPPTVDATKLREMFEKYGTVTECQTVKDYAFVHMDSESAADNAIKALHNLSIDGGVLTVEKSHGRPSKAKQREVDSRRGGDRRDSYRDDRRDYGRGGGGGYRDRSPVDRRRDDYGRSDYSRAGVDRYGRYGAPSGDPVSYYGDRSGSYGGRAPYDSRAPPPSSYGYSDPYARRSPPRSYGGGGGYDNYDRYSRDGGRGYGSSTAPAAGVTRRY